MTQPVERSQVLARKAEVTRARLLRIVDVLDARRHHVAAVGRKLAGAATVTLVAAGAVVLAGAVYAVSRWNQQRRRHRFLRPREKPLIVVVAERAVVTAVTLLVSEALRAAVRRFGPKRVLH